MNTEYLFIYLCLLQIILAMLYFSEYSYLTYLVKFILMCLILFDVIVILSGLLMPTLDQIFFSVYLPSLMTQCPGMCLLNLLDWCSVDFLKSKLEK